MSIELGPPGFDGDDLPDHLRDVSLESVEKDMFGHHIGGEYLTEQDMDALRAWDMADARHFHATQEWADRFDCWCRHLDFCWHHEDLCCNWYSVAAMIRDMPDVADLNGGFDSVMMELADVSQNLLWAQATGIAYNGNGVQGIYEDWMETQIAPNGRASV